VITFIQDYDKKNEKKFTSRQQIVDMLSSIMQSGLFYHVLRQHTFKDDYLYFRFQEDDEANSNSGSSTIQPLNVKYKSADASSVSSALNPLKLVEDLRELLTELNTFESYAQYKTSTEFVEFQKKAALLTSVKIDDFLKNDDVKIKAFFINLHNGMLQQENNVVHCKHQSQR